MGGKRVARAELAYILTCICLYVFIAESTNKHQICSEVGFGRLFEVNIDYIFILLTTTEMKTVISWSALAVRNAYV